MDIAIKNVRQKSMRRTYFFLCLLIICVVLLSFVLQIFAIRSILLKNTEQLLQATHQQSYDNIHKYFDNMENVAYSLGYNASVQKYLNEKDPVEKIMLFGDVQTVFSSVAMMQDDVQGYAIYDKNGDFLVANGSNYQAIIQADKIHQSTNIVYSSFYPPNPYIGVTVPYYTISVPVLDSNLLTISNNIIGTVVFTMNQSYIKAQVDTGNVFDGCNMMVIDSDGHQIAGFANDTISISGFNDSDTFITLKNTFPNNDWRLITYFKKGIVAENMKSLWSTAIVTSVIIVVLIIAFIILLSKQILSPIANISHFMRKVSRNESNGCSEGVYQYNLPAKWNYDELASMVNAMNHMFNSLNEKTNALLDKEKQYYEAVLAGNRMEVLAYRNQINPHFLYNTFECIKGIALSHNAMEIVEISQSLSQMFRYAVKGENFVTVDEELHHMQEYALIIRYRFMGRIEININAEKETLFCRIPRLTLQPIVENAVFHGLEKQIGPGRINVNVFIEDNYIHMIVTDNGLGMDVDMVEQVNESIKNSSNNSGIGLSNIAHRLHLFYEQDSEIKISSTLREGTSVEIKLPAVWGGSEDVSSNFSG